MPQLLVELLSEEIPARMQPAAARDLERMARERLTAAGLPFGRLRTFAGPRRLTLVVDDLPAAQGGRSEERKGPRLGAPEAALAGFLRSTGLTQDQLVERDGVWFATIARPGRRHVESGFSRFRRKGGSIRPVKRPESAGSYPASSQRTSSGASGTSKQERFRARWSGRAETTANTSGPR